MKATKNGSMMAFVQLEDLYGVTEVLVFPKVYERMGAMLDPEAPVLMSGRLSVREEEAPKLLLDRVVPLRGAVAAVAPQLPETPAQAAPRYPVSKPKGAMKLYLKLKKDQAPRNYWVDEGYDFGALANLLGADSIVLK